MIGSHDAFWCESVNTQGLFQLSETARGWGLLLSVCLRVCVCVCVGQWSVAHALQGRTWTEGSIVVTASWGTIPLLTVFVVYNQVSQTAKHTHEHTNRCCLSPFLEKTTCLILLNFHMNDSLDYRHDCVCRASNRPTTIILHYFLLSSLISLMWWNFHETSEKYLKYLEKKNILKWTW